MSYTYPEALAALEGIANDYLKLMRGKAHVPAYLVCDPTASTASVTWDATRVCVNMPVRAATSKMSQVEFEDWTAYLLHELGHPTHTDKAAWIKAVQTGLSRLTNALEDVRMEKAVIASGIVPNAHAVLSRLVSRKIAEAKTDGWKPNARKEFGWTVCVLGRVANGYAIEASDVAWIKGQIKPGSTVESVLGWALPALAACTCTDDCVALAARIAAALAAPTGTGGQTGEDGEGEAGEAGRGEAGKGKGKAGEAGEGKGEAGEGEAGEGKGEGEERPTDAPKPSDAPSDNGQGKGKGKGKGGKGRGDGSSSSDELPVTNETQLKNRDLAPESKKLKRPEAMAEKAIIDILRDKRDMEAQPRTRRTLPPSAEAQGAILKDAAAKASHQRALLARALRANETDDRETGRKSGRLDRSALSRAVAGSANVFERRETSEGFDTDVTILLDASGSMGGPNMSAALEMGLVIAQAAGSVGAPCTTEVFNSMGFSRAGGLASKQAPNPAEFGALIDSATGGTPLSEHMARAAMSQAKRAPHKRRVVFVVTDGDCDFGPATVKKMASYLETACGTILAHVSIGNPLRGAFKAEVQVPYGASVADVGLEHFVKVLQAL